MLLVLRAIRVLVRADLRPEDMVSFQFMTVEGHVALPTADKVRYSTEIELGTRTPYLFTDDMVLLEAWRIESGDEIWAVPE
jgi:isocitrate dehydrogenase kinase/phosphatase